MRKNIMRITLLYDWLLQEERTASWFARQCNVSPAAVKYWIDGKTRPSKKHRKAIYEITGIEL